MSSTEEIGAIPFVTETVGPFNDGDFYRLTYDGYVLPHVHAHLRKGTEHIWDIALDGRLWFELTDTELHHVIPLLANAMAIAAGYSSFGENCRMLNPFQVRMTGITFVTQETT